MSEHLKNRVIDGLKSSGAYFVPLPKTSNRSRKHSGTARARAVRYFRMNTAVNCLWGAMDQLKDGQARRKRIVVRLSRFYNGLHELYTYHFPKHWSAACVANRELIKEAQRRAHALEHDHSLAALEWRMRFFNHYFQVCKGGAKPEQGMKAYARFYQYTYVAIYRQLKEEAQKAKEPDYSTEELSFEPIRKDVPFRLRHHRGHFNLDCLLTSVCPHREEHAPPN